MKFSQLIVISILFFCSVFSSGFAQDSLNNRLIVSVSEAEVSELDLRRGLWLHTRTELDVVSESDAEEILNLLEAKLNEIGWTSSWQQTREDKLIANFFALGGANLRLELDQNSPNSYRLLFYRY